MLYWCLLDVVEAEWELQAKRKWLVEVVQQTSFEWCYTGSQKPSFHISPFIFSCVRLLMFPLGPALTLRISCSLKLTVEAKYQNHLLILRGEGSNYHHCSITSNSVMLASSIINFQVGSLYS
jgi:hypothetical protein